MAIAGVAAAELETEGAGEMRHVKEKVVLEEEKEEEEEEAPKAMVGGRKRLSSSDEEEEGAGGGRGGTKRTRGSTAPAASASASAEMKGEVRALMTTVSQRSGSTSEMRLQDEKEAAFIAAAVISALPPHHIVRAVGHDPKLPPLREPGIQRPTLVLDLDETLVHCTLEPIEKADHVFGVNFAGDASVNVYMRARPDLSEFLRAVKDDFEVVIFTASEKSYADKVLDRLDPDGEFIAHRLYRESCLCVGGNYIKDLSVLGRDLSRVTIVDNSPHAFGYQLSNGIPIASWFDDDDDESLMMLLPFLNQLARLDDVRPLIASTFKMHCFVAAARSMLANGYFW